MAWLLKVRSLILHWSRETAGSPFQRVAELNPTPGDVLQHHADKFEYIFILLALPSCNYNRLQEEDTV